MSSRRVFRACVVLAAFLAIAVLAADVSARGRGGGGMSRGGGGIGRGGGGGFGRPNISYGGPARSGSMRSPGGFDRASQRPSPSTWPGPGQRPGAGLEPGGAGQRPSAGQLPSAEQRPSAGQLPSAGQRPGAGQPPSASQLPSRPEQRPGTGEPDGGGRDDDRQDNIDDRREFRQSNIEDRQEFRQDAWDEYGYHDYDEWYEDRWKYAMGASLTVAMFSSLSCQPTTVIAGGVTYYRCVDTWYQRVYSGGSTTYVVVNAP